MLKNYNTPYFSFNGTKSFIKLKKDYIPGLENTTDLVVINRRRDIRDEGELNIRKL